MVKDRLELLPSSTYVLQYSTPPSARSLPASRSAFSSACKHRHSSSATPLLIGVAAPLLPAPLIEETDVELHLAHPPSLQFRIPRGVPLYPWKQSGLSQGDIEFRSVSEVQLTCTDHTLVRYKYSSDASFHAITPVTQDADLGTRPSLASG